MGEIIMKKVICSLAVLLILGFLIGCSSAKVSDVSVNEFKNILQVSEFDVQKSGKEYSFDQKLEKFPGDVSVNGTTDKDKNLIQMNIVNNNVDTSVLKDEQSITKTLNKVNEMNAAKLSQQELNAATAALEMTSVYSICTGEKSDLNLIQVVNKFMNDKSFIENGWHFEATVYTDTLTVTAKYVR